MFTGIIEEVGNVLSIHRSNSGAIISVGCNHVLSGVKDGDSIAVNGVCLTVTRHDSAGFQADISNESLRVTSLGQLKSGDGVNVERAMAATGRFDGHMVAGHVDTTAQIMDISRDGNSWKFRLRLHQPECIRYFIERGSASIDGVSLTVFDVDTATASFTFNLIPHSQSLTTLTTKKSGDVVNIECDLVAKYIERLLGFGTSGATPASQGGVSMELLRQHGFM
ncbi:riboflavin synthase [Desulfurispirillum indicum]|uniref:Riboflavin synthase n=1 Tax=Desulfurispirillum indicum (strain ATCC BAA-1389 / DSM 22839 / S5) TaxID=653733 RepID=E6W3W3_DESIS|nr:riboflavin synthase [Desulfurispirillum indicum]ADU65831.1 riboflavin synthase, alpha subunit [Desulfurispirillum indicum S5]UCZ57766.1 riboflavin synthase [Desulfurispirillum indicum]